VSPVTTAPPVLEVERSGGGSRGGQARPAVGVLTRTEARRILTSPAIPILLGYLMLVLGVDFLSGGDERAGLSHRYALAELLGYVSLLILGPITFVAANLVATSARRSGAHRLLGAAPVDQRRRDLALCGGVLLGPATVGLAVAGLSAWLASGVVHTPTGDLADHWSWIDLAQVPAIVLGAGVLGVVVARWLPYPGSSLLGLVALVLMTGWLEANGGGWAVRPWLAPYVAIEWWTDEPWASSASPVWHLAYLLSLSSLGVCVVALRQPGRARWCAAGAVALAAVVVTGLVQLP
jgi:hypothetical protein